MSYEKQMTIFLFFLFWLSFVSAETECWENEAADGKRVQPIYC